MPSHVAIAPLRERASWWARAVAGGLLCQPDMRLGLPEHIRACLFDLDGVLTETSRVHAAAWKETFDAYLRARAQAMGTPFVPFDGVRDYEL